jgi:hypothetical protein
MVAVLEAASNWISKVIIFFNVWGILSMLFTLLPYFFGYNAKTLKVRIARRFVAHGENLP